MLDLRKRTVICSFAYFFGMSFSYRRTSVSISNNIGFGSHHDFCLPCIIMNHGRKYVRRWGAFKINDRHSICISVKDRPLNCCSCFVYAHYKSLKVGSILDSAPDLKLSRRPWTYQHLIDTHLAKSIRITEIINPTHCTSNTWRAINSN